MTETRTMTEADAGTWLDGFHGWTNGYRAVERAVEWGWKIPEEYAEGWAAFQANYGDSDLWHDANGDDGGFVDKATDYLQEIAPEGFVFRWDDGLALIPDWSDCAADGGGCSVDWKSNGKGGLDEVVTRCPDHTPDGEEFTGEPIDDGDGPRPGELGKPWETTVNG